MTTYAPVAALLLVIAVAWIAIVGGAAIVTSGNRQPEAPMGDREDQP